MLAVKTAGEPPNQGRINFVAMSCTWKSRNALRKIVTAYATRTVGGGFSTTALGAGVLVCTKAVGRPGMNNILSGSRFEPECRTNIATLPSELKKSVLKEHRCEECKRLTICLSAEINS